MSKCYGLTEAVWTELPEDKRISWKYFARLIGVLGAFFVTRTGNVYFDAVLGLSTALFLMIVIETQRTYSRLKPSFRKRNIRIAIALGSWGVAVLGIAIFSQAALATTASLVSSDVLPALNRSASSLTHIVTLLALLLAIPAAVVHAFRQLNVMALVYKIPRDGLKRLLIHKQPKATTFGLFAYMELSALLVCLAYASSVAEVSNVFLYAVRLM